MSARAIDIEAPDSYGQSTKNQALVEHCHKLVRRTKSTDGLWRTKGWEGVEYYFGKQWSDKDKRIVIDRGQEPIVNNLTKPNVRLMIGLMLAQPYDWSAKPMGMNDDNLAQAVSAGLKYLANYNRVPDQLRWVYWWGLTYGVAVIRVGPHVRWDDPRREICQSRVIDPREIGRDPDSREPDASDMRFMRWTRKIDVADARRKWPKLTPDNTPSEGADEGAGGDPLIEVNTAPIDLTPPPSMWDDFESWNKYGDDEVDRETQKVTVHEVWEIKHTTVFLADVGSGSPVEIDKGDVAAHLLMPHVKRVWKDSVPKVWTHVICGPLLLESGRAEAKHDRIPFVFYFYELDGHGCPVSMVESYKDMQREENYRRAKMLYELGNQPVIVAPEVAMAMGLKGVDAIAKHAGKRSPVWIAAPGQVEYPQTGNMASQQFELMQHSEQAIQKQTGANDHLMGYDSPTTSGVSKELSMQQGATIQRAAESSLRLFHKAFGELLLSDMCQYHDSAWTVRITDDVGRDKTYTLNAPNFDPATGQMTMVNNINQYEYDLDLETVPYSPTQRQRSADRIIELYQSEQNPIAKAALRKLAITLDDIPNKPEVLAILDKADAAPPAPPPPAPRKDIRDMLNFAPIVVPPAYISSALAEAGMQPGPMPAGPPAPTEPTGQPGQDPNAPAPVDQNNLINQNAKLEGQRMKQQHESTEKAKDRQHDLHKVHIGLAGQAMGGGMQHGSAMAQGAQQHTSKAVLAAQQHEQALEQSQQSFDLAPTPPPSSGGSSSGGNNQ